MPKWARNRLPGLGWSWYVTLCHGGHLGYQIRLPLAIQNLMLCEKFQDCHHGRHLGYWNWMIKQFWISISPPCLPSSFSSTWLIVWEEMWLEEFQDGGHLGHWDRRILANLNFHNTPIPPIMFKLSQTYPSVADVIWRFSRWLPWWPSWISEQNHFSNSKSPCCLDAFHQAYWSGVDNKWRLTR